MEYILYTLGIFSYLPHDKVKPVASSTLIKLFCFWGFTVLMCLSTRCREPGEYREGRGRGGPAVTRRGSDLPDQQCRDQRVGGLSNRHRRDDDGKLPYQRCGSTNDHQGKVSFQKKRLYSTLDL